MGALGVLGLGTSMVAGLLEAGARTVISPGVEARKSAGASTRHPQISPNRPMIPGERTPDGSGSSSMASRHQAWSKGSMEDEANWDLMVFLKVIPSLSPEKYRRRVEASDGHSHGRLEGHDAEHRHDAKPHSHKISVYEH